MNNKTKQHGHVFFLADYDRIVKNNTLSEGLLPYSRTFV
jgi:hypothetical protein